MTAAGIEARRVLYSGRVQGVGFRYTARRIAQQHTVTGFVRNLDDGRVELVAEGAASEIDGLLAEIAEAMSGYIRDVRVDAIPVTGRYASFDVAF
jgi:acylphosphatase